MQQVIKRLLGKKIDFDDYKNDILEAFEDYEFRGVKDIIIDFGMNHYTCQADCYMAPILTLYMTDNIVTDYDLEEY